MHVKQLTSEVWPRVHGLGVKGDSEYLRPHQVSGHPESPKTKFPRQVATGKQRLQNKTFLFLFHLHSLKLYIQNTNVTLT